jgi:glycolate oxidase FAD binding subunit
MPADLAISTSRLARIIAIEPDDLVATVEAGVRIADLATALAAAGLWLPLDPPGGSGRSIGSLAATGTVGPLRHGFGSLRDQVLGCEVVMADGRLAEGGGRVVKNVAGFDLPKLHVGGFGAFGVITRLHLRLRARPARDVTALATGDRSAIIAAAREVHRAGLSLCALELASPLSRQGGEWRLAARLAGTEEGTGAEAPRLGEVTGLSWRPLEGREAAELWDAFAATTSTVSVRMGCLPGDIDAVIGLVERDLGPGTLTVGIGTGQVRYRGEVAAEPLLALRRKLADLDVPLTVERAPWAVRCRVGHVGALRTGVGPLVRRLRAVHDPGGSIVTALEGTDG